MNMLQLLGALLIILSLAVGFWLVARGSAQKAGVRTVTIGGVFIGGFLCLNERITEVTISHIGTIKAATAQATSDARMIAEIKERVENQSSTVDLVAARAARANELWELAANDIKLIDEKLSSIDKIIYHANIAINRLNSESDFLSLIITAQNDDRRAFDKLREISNNKSDSFSKRAQSSYYAIYEVHTKPYFTPETASIHAEIDAARFTISNFINEYNSFPVEVRPGLIRYISYREDFKLSERLQFLISVINSDDSLKAVEHAGRHFIALTKLNIKPLDIEYMVKWWEEHKSNFEGK